MRERLIANVLMKAKVKRVKDYSNMYFIGRIRQEEQSFEHAIKLLTDSALPDSRYSKDIHIDDSSLLRVNADSRIALLRIIQEAITNIIKHAKAKNVGILIYEEMDNLLLVIHDDGKGLGEQKPNNGKSAMGLQSIRRRAQYLNGVTSIRSDTNGTEITISVPVNSFIPN
jgi:signal transduction histidine kinase